MFHNKIIAGKDILACINFKPLLIIAAGIGKLKICKEVIKQKGKHARVNIPTDQPFLLRLRNDLRIHGGGNRLHILRDQPYQLRIIFRRHFIIELDEILELPGSGLHSADNQLQLIADIHIRLRQRPERLLQYGDAVVHGG